MTTLTRTGLAVATAVVTALTLGAVPGSAATETPDPGASASPPASTFFATTRIDSGATVGAPAVGDNQNHGDLWPNCWSDDNHVYTAYGDGVGFAGAYSDIGVARIEGAPGTLSGHQLAIGDRVGQVWTPNHTRKPTGMACVGNTLYLAVQDLAFDFNSAPAATIAKSTDRGQTWTWDRGAPMFGGGKFSTVMFLDYGKAYGNAPDGYVYAYGLDHNWRDSFNDRVPDPVDVYLARVPQASVMDRSTWRFFAGADASGSPTWTANMDSRVAVMHDDRRIYQNVISNNIRNLSVISQGGVVYNKPLNRYIYTSWTEYTYEFYEAPTPWGPWKHFKSKDFGGYPWTHTKHGGYATTIPSKYISADGKSMWLQSNVCPCGGGYPNGDHWAYTFSLRKMNLEPYAPTTPSNPVDGNRNLARESGTVPIERAMHYGNVGYYNDGNRNQSDDDWNDERKGASWWGYTWPRSYHMNKVVYTTGNMFGDGGWFASGLKVQVRRNHQWVDATGLRFAPGYPYNSGAGPHKTYVLSFDSTSGDGVRIIGAPGGTVNFTSIAELEVYHGSAVTDPGFEMQPTSSLNAPWRGEGPAAKGIDRGLGFAHNGGNNAWIRADDASWNAILQTVPVKPNTNYRLTGWIHNSNNFSEGYFGVRAGTGSTPYAERRYGGLTSYSPQTVEFNSGSHTTMTVFAGYWAPGADSWVRLDDVTLTPV
ncbi:MAG: hypothetical protein ACRDTU_17000 [Micromonosporaceae bacterium]